MQRSIQVPSLHNLKNLDARQEKPVNKVERWLCKSLQEEPVNENLTKDMHKTQLNHFKSQSIDSNPNSNTSSQKSLWDKSTIASTNFVEENEEASASSNCLLKDESSARISHAPQAPMQPRPPPGNGRNVMKRNSNTSSSAPVIPTVDMGNVLELPAKNANQHTKSDSILVKAPDNPSPLQRGRGLKQVQVLSQRSEKSEIAKLEEELKSFSFNFAVRDGASDSDGEIMPEMQNSMLRTEYADNILEENVTENLRGENGNSSLNRQFSNADQDLSNCFSSSDGMGDQLLRRKESLKHESENKNNSIEGKSATAESLKRNSVCEDDVNDPQIQELQIVLPSLQRTSRKKLAVLETENLKQIHEQLLKETEPARQDRLMSYITRLELLQNTDYNMLEAMLGEAHCYYLKKILFNALEAKATKFLDNENNYGSEFAVRSLDNLMNNHMASKFQWHVVEHCDITRGVGTNYLPAINRTTQNIQEKEDRINLSYRRYLNDDLEKQMGTERTEVIFSICPPKKQPKQNELTNLYCAYDQGQGQEEDLTVTLKIREMYLDTSGVVPRSQREAMSNGVKNENLLTADQIVGLMLNSLLERQDKVLNSNSSKQSCRNVSNKNTYGYENGCDASGCESTSSSCPITPEMSEGLNEFQLRQLKRKLEKKDGKQKMIQSWFKESRYLKFSFPGFENLLAQQQAELDHYRDLKEDGKLKYVYSNISPLQNNARNMMLQINEIFGTTFGNLRVKTSYCDDTGRYYADFVCEQFFFKVQGQFGWQTGILGAGQGSMSRTISNGNSLSQSRSRSAGMSRGNQSRQDLGNTGANAINEINSMNRNGKAQHIDLDRMERNDDMETNKNLSDMELNGNVQFAGTPQFCEGAFNTKVLGDFSVVRPK